MPARPAAPPLPASPILPLLIALLAATFPLAASPILPFPDALPTGDYQLETAYSQFDTPIALAHPPSESNQLFVAERAGRIRVISDLATETVEPDAFLDIASRVTTNSENGLLGLAFHPNYASNRQFFVFYTTERDNGSRSNRVSRFLRSEDDPFSANPNSELILFDQTDDRNNHNGGDIHFGPDGYLYIALGDEGAANDSRDNSQRVEKDFFSGILRLDVDKREGNIEPTPHPDLPRYEGNLAAYRIPADNPLVDRWQSEGADPDSSLRLEFYAIGLRNPWRMAFDPATGQLWAGDVGQGAREEVNLIEKGGNYGWAFKEGTLDGPKNQTPPQGFQTVIDPIHEYGRSDGFSITGGLVYRGARLPELEGAYLFGDYGSGTIWALFPDFATGNHQRLPIANYPSHYEFGIDPANGDVLVAGGAGDIRRLVRGQNASDPGFPETLSATEAFSDLSSLAPAAGLQAYEPIQPFWSDYASKRRWLALPDAGAQIGFQPDDPWTIPSGTVFIKHFELERERGNPDTRFPVETRFLVKTQQSAYGLSYRWNEAGTEATLVGENGTDIDVSITVDEQDITQTWRIPSRSECLQCHTAAAGYALSANTRQLNRDFPHQGTLRNTLEYFSEIGILDTAIPDASELPKHTPIDQSNAPLEARSRTYLDVNCAACHQPGGGAPNTWDARAKLAIESTGLIDGIPSNDGGNPGYRLAKRGAPDESVLFHRIAATEGFSRMPPLASNELDLEAIDLIRAWLSIEAPSSISFEEWQSLHFDGPQDPLAAAAADPDKDGNPNRLEYLNRTDPLDANDRWAPSFHVRPDQLDIRFPMSPNRQYEAQISDDLENWTPLETEGNPPESDSLETLPAEIATENPDPNSSQFLRIQVSE